MNNVRNSRKPSWKKILISLFAIILIIVVFFVILDIVNSNKINFGAEVASISIGGITKDEALNKLNLAKTKLFDENFNLIYILVTNRKF